MVDIFLDMAADSPVPVLSGTHSTCSNRPNFSALHDKTGYVQYAPYIVHLFYFFFVCILIFALVQ